MNLKWSFNFQGRLRRYFFAVIRRITTYFENSMTYVLCHLPQQAQVLFIAVLDLETVCGGQSWHMAQNAQDFFSADPVAKTFVITVVTPLSDALLQVLQWLLCMVSELVNNHKNKPVLILVFCCLFCYANLNQTLVGIRVYIFTKELSNMIVSNQ